MLVGTYRGAGASMVEEAKDPKVEAMEDILKEADKAITSIMVSGMTVWVCCVDPTKLSEMGEVASKLMYLFKIDEEDGCFAPTASNKRMKGVGAYYVER